MQINTGSIQSKIDAYLKLEECKRKKADYVNNAMLNSSRLLSNSSNAGLPTDDVMNEAARILISEIQKTALSLIPDSAGSVRNLISNDLCITQYANTVGKNKDGINIYELHIGFRDSSALHRMSLRTKKGKYLGGGIDNIVSLFDTGYTNHIMSGSGRLRGYWDSVTSGDTIYTLNKPHRDALGFIASSVELFNNGYGKFYNCHAKIVADDEYYFRI